MTTTERFFARIPFKYAGQPLDRGELIILKGTRRDDQLRGLGYFLKFDPREHTESMCDGCGRKFAGSAFRDEHKRKKGGCLADEQEITKGEFAMLVDKDVKDVQVEDF